MRKIVLTGGHAATTAIAVVEEIIRRYQDKPLEIYWIGVKNAFEGREIPTLESVHFSKLGIKTYFIRMGRLQRRFTLWTIPSLLKIPFGLLHALYLVIKTRPDVIVSFGGFAAFPVVLAGKLLGIPSLLHEQTAAAGRANLFSLPFVNKVALARKESIKHFGSSKSVVVGNPVMTQILEVPAKEKMSKIPVLFVTGGSRGSQVVNEALKPILKNLLEKFYVIHQTGLIDYLDFKKLKEKLSSELASRYEVYSLIDPMQIDGVYRRADMIVARAGANTVAEIMVVKRPAILIPIPFSYLDEQTKNAIFAKKFGIAKVLKQDELSSKRLFEEIEDIYLNWEVYVRKSKDKISPDINAASNFVDLVEKVAHG
ncbi:MAG: UDP-N-acetylglucosamine--N-acetylmuramyl-(pentapeptide) pyrophosphoryl-undecaprenol N-acetylglucosamine transferase [Candidatus Woesebacteria bacterium]|nr:MAG: UDP-N-acetylglucosamine--N-acetylmuramyl-(pentapeptide) pyrophosphoryl-undecaprenol N-acetylglucosamine transferase [Candidatus Woesebacteria bacterium]